MAKICWYSLMTDFVDIINPDGIEIDRFVLSEGTINLPGPIRKVKSIYIKVCQGHLCVN